MLFVLCALPMALGFDVTLLVTREVRGAVYPVNRWKTECGADAAAAAAATTLDCDCYGGVSKRRTVLEAARSTHTARTKLMSFRLRDYDPALSLLWTAPGVIALDTGAYFSGSGLFFPAFHGNSSASFFASAKYDAFALNYRDFGAGISVEDPTGGRFLAHYINKIRLLNPASPAAVVSNLNLTGDPHLATATPTRQNPRPAGHIMPFTLHELPDNRTLAVLNLIDPTHLILSPHYASRVLPFESSLSWRLAQLRRLPEGPPDVIICVLGGVPITDDQVSAAGGTQAAQTDVTLRLAQTAVGVDAFVLATHQVSADPQVTASQRSP